METQTRSNDTNSPFTERPEYHYRVWIWDTHKSWDEQMKRRLPKSNISAFVSKDLMLAREEAFGYVENLLKLNPSLVYLVALMACEERYGEGEFFDYMVGGNDECDEESIEFEAMILGRHISKDVKYFK